MEKFKVNGAIARGLIKELARQGTIKQVGQSSAKFDLFTGVQAVSALDKEKNELAAAAEKMKKKWILEPSRSIS